MKLKRVAKIVLCLALLFVMGGECLLSPFLVKAEANTSKYSNVLDDLKKDKTFSAENYPLDGTRNDLQIIQIAESENRELFIYVYQPGYETKDYQAKYINMALQDMIDPDLEYKLYSLTLLNSNGQFAKYLVNGLTVSSDQYRYYNIATVYRDFDSDVDIWVSSVDKYNCKGFSVASLWCAYYLNDQIVYEHEQAKVVKITYHSSGTVRYPSGFILKTEKCDSHYVGFTVDNFNVDKIYNAKITFQPVLVERFWRPGMDQPTVIEYTESFIERELSAEGDNSLGSYRGEGLFGKTYSWPRISTVSAFKEQLEVYGGDQLSEDELKELEGSEFIFQFWESTFTMETSWLDSSYNTQFYEARNIGVLQLDFLAEGKRYNLGCVSDLVSTDSVPDFDLSVKMPDFLNEDLFSLIISLLFLLVSLMLFTPLLGPLLPMIFTFLFKGIAFLLRLVIYVLLFPFNLLFARRKKSRK